AIALGLRFPSSLYELNFIWRIDLTCDVQYAIKIHTRTVPTYRTIFEDERPYMRTTLEPRFSARGRGSRSRSRRPDRSALARRSARSRRASSRALSATAPAAS